MLVGVSWIRPSVLTAVLLFILAGQKQVRAYKTCKKLTEINNNLIFMSVHLCNIDDNVERHEVLPLSPELRRFCIFSLTFSQDGNEVLGGANDGCLYIYDCEKRIRTLRVSFSLGS